MSLAEARFPLLILLWVTPRQRGVMAKDGGSVWKRGGGVRPCDSATDGSFS